LIPLGLTAQGFKDRCGIQVLGNPDKLTAIMAGRTLPPC
jgi:hypothetical protein